MQFTLLGYIFIIINEMLFLNIIYFYTNHINIYHRSVHVVILNWNKYEVARYYEFTLIDLCCTPAVVRHGVSSNSKESSMVKLLQDCLLALSFQNWSTVSR